MKFDKKSIAHSMFLLLMTRGQKWRRHNIDLVVYLSVIVMKEMGLINRSR